MPSGACWLLGGSFQGWPVHPELRVEVKWLSPCTSGRCQLPLWPPHGHLWENELSELETVIMALCFLPAWASTGLSSAVGNIYLLQVRTLTSPGDSCRA